jgi:hypothetical protein
MAKKSARAAAGVAALVAWFGLAMQLWVSIGQFAAKGSGVAAALWRVLGYFTILTNLGVAIVATAMALAPGARIAGPRPRLAMAVAIVLVGIVYSVALRHILNATGLAAVADHALHDVSPVTFLIAWAVAGHGGLRWRDSLWALPWPSAYFAYAMARGAASGWYAYWFLDPANLSPVRFAINVALLIASFAAAGVILIAADRALARRAG